MKAALCTSLDGPDGIVIADVAAPEAGPGEVVIEVEAVGLNFMDTLITRGKYQDKPELPFSPGGEVAGRIFALGAGVEGWSVGDRVCAYVGHGGARAQIAVDARLLVRVPPAIGPDVAAGLNVTYGTAMYGLFDCSALALGQTIAVLGATGGAGLAAVEVAKLAGANVIAVGTSLEKLQVCREHGADTLIATTAPQDDLKERLRAQSGGAGVDVVYDCVGGAYAEPALRGLRWGGRFLVVGFAAGEIPRLPLNIVMLKNSYVIGVSWGPATRSEPSRQVRHIAQVMAWIEEGRLKPHVHEVLPLERTADAIRALAERRVTGKVILKV